jgi:gluconolactonase
MAQESASPELSRLVSSEAKLEKLATGLKFVEGPVWMPSNFLVFSDIPADELKRWGDGTLTTFRAPSHQSNGNTIDRQGRLVTCEHRGRRVTRTEYDGSITVLADSYEGKPLNSPNDVVVQSDGTIWFTDPPYGIPKGQKQEQERNNVFALDPQTKQLRAVVSDFDRPNGLCFSPDEKKLYIADSGKPRHIRVFDVTPDHQLTNGRLFATIDKGAPDGIRCDREGNLFSSAGDGVHVFSPDGKLLGKIPVPETPANLCFGGADGHTLFITARTSLYAIPTRTSAP